MAGRGQARHSKRGKALQGQSVHEEIDDLLHQALDYLRRELGVFTASAGNANDVIRIAKALRDLAGPSIDPSVSAAQEARDRFLAAFLGTQEQEGHPED